VLAQAGVPANKTIALKGAHLTLIGRLASLPTKKHLETDPGKELGGQEM